MYAGTQQGPCSDQNVRRQKASLSSSGQCCLHQVSLGFCRAGHLQKQALLRVHELRLGRRHPEQPRIKLRDARQPAAEARAERRTACAARLGIPPRVGHQADGVARRPQGRSERGAQGCVCVAGQAAGGEHLHTHAAAASNEELRHTMLEARTQSFVHQLGAALHELACFLKQRTL